MCIYVNLYVGLNETILVRFFSLLKHVEKFDMDSSLTPRNDDWTVRYCGLICELFVGCNCMQFQMIFTSNLWLGLWFIPWGNLCSSAWLVGRFGTCIRNPFHFLETLWSVRIAGYNASMVWNSKSCHIKILDQINCRYNLFRSRLADLTCKIFHWRKVRWIDTIFNRFVVADRTPPKNWQKICMLVEGGESFDDVFESMGSRCFGLGIW